MEIWLIWAIASVFAAGFHAFTLKMIAERNYNPSLVSVYSYFFSSVISLFYFAFFSSWNFDSFWILFWLAFINVLFYFLSILSRVTSMKEMDTTIFFPLYKTFGPILMTMMSVLYFKESLTSKEILGILLGIMVPLLLITKTENRIQRNLKKGLVFLLLTVLLTTLGMAAAKESMVREFDVPLLMLVVMSLGTVFSYISYKFFRTNNHKGKYVSENILVFGIISGVLNFLSYFTILEALKGNLAVAFTINSFYILIPIILSIIFYKEHFNFKKGFVIFLSIVSVILFI